MKLKHITLIAVAILMSTSCNTTPAPEHVEKHEHEHENIELTAEQIRTIGIELGELSRVSLGVNFRATGELAVDPQDEATVVPQTPGIVKRIVVKEGDKVAKGQLVAYVENLEVLSLQQDYFAARQEELLASQELDRQEALAAAGAGIKKNRQQAAANAQIAAAKTAMLAKQLALYGITAVHLTRETPITAVPLVAPIGGTVTQILGTTGSYADTQAPLMKIVNNNAVYAKLRIFEKNLDEITAGRRVELRLTNRPDIILEGEVVSVTQAVDTDTKALTARVKIIPSTDEGKHRDTAVLTPNMPVIGLIAAEKSEVDALPDEAIVSAEGRSYVFVLEEEKHEAHEHEHDEDEEIAHFKKVEVITGVKERGYTEVKFLTKVVPNARFVLKNAFYLGSMTAEHGEHSH